ncbi:hypothetical protein GWK47_038027 [Chionoecetes opilio]|uniref:Reverse transcriptase n=1 Tax=Chionoecetes opilio TaxID=41210 RepID=A0A8J4YEI0_CHIOP|nr:hypothetical protein GWK47_038027 [Chionoecetes opilio]
MYGKWMKDSVKVERWTGELGMFVTGVMRHGSMAVCKKEINRRVEEKGKEEWLRGMSEKSTLEWYRRKDQPRYERFYDGGYGGDLLFRARTKSLEVNSRMYRWKNDGSKVCEMCVTGVDETVEHLMLECERYEYARTQMLEVVVGEVGVEEWREMRDRRVEMEYLLGLCAECRSDSRVIESVKEFLENSWRARRREHERQGAPQ